jgi:hypothetical protein
VEGAGAHLDVVRLQDHATLSRPEAMQAEDQVLEGQRPVGHGVGSTVVGVCGIKHGWRRGQGGAPAFASACTLRTDGELAEP